MRIRSAATATGALLGLSALILSTASARAASAGAATHHDGTVVLAHRGASAYAPENTISAVNAADRLGIEWVENDVQRTKDGELIIMHDTSLARTTNVEQVFPGRAPWNVSDFTLREIEKLDAGSWFGPQFKGERVPTMEAYMDAVENNGQKLLMELKAPELYPGVERQALRELRAEGWLDRHHVKRRLIIQSFNADSVKKVHQLRPDVKTGFLGTPAVSELPKYQAFADQINPNHGTINAAYVSTVHALKGPHGRPMEVYTWTVDDARNTVKVAKMGVDGIISNKPDVVRDALDEAGSRSRR
ncbi:glycerophosphodiester phosphodiesterase family protein [Streptomyces sp. MST-110588]|uniref:glycerophosphodiester phosphodiesterase n=1 Tax=Streptomyces sp. MST-110588 TaxID=2833628 RepID=UPI001F5D7448|nr:glycerophosphodiester phosphodiesterase family protein [Streptomyces sp. MST-110588]UNO42687.1 glycerophosphodiester phosphodiesterase [Streptomyces sp. MST-110588]